MTEPVEQVRFTSNIDCDGSVKTDKRNNLRQRRGRLSTVCGIRSKFVLEGARQELYHLQQENEQLRTIIMQRIEPPELAEKILLECQSPPVDIFLSSNMLMEEDETKHEEGEKKEESEFQETWNTNMHDNQPSHLIRIGQEIDILEPPAPLEAFPASCRQEMNEFTSRAFELDVEDEEQCLVDAFAGDFAF